MSSAQPHEHDYLRLPLDGVQLIEASAGTGKTFTLATLFTRLVVEQQLRIGQILAVTFTDAATQELRRRIRERLALASRIAGSAAGADEDQETALTRAILDRHLRQGAETSTQLARRLRIAAEEIDLASIFTIHGFCARVLSEHALDSGQAFDTQELLANLQPLHVEVAADLWRLHADDPEALDALTSLWNGPDALAADLRALLRDLPLLPEPPSSATGDDPHATYEAAGSGLVQAIAASVDDAQARVAQAFDGKVFDGRRARRASFDKAFDELRSGRSATHWPRGKTSHLSKLLPAQMLAFCKDGQAGKVPASPLFDALQAWCDADDAME